MDPAETTILKKKRAKMATDISMARV